MFLIDDSVAPTLALAWTAADGVKRAEATLPFGSAAERSTITDNLEAFVALGGTRLDTGSGDPTGLIVRVGFYKLDPGTMLLPSIAGPGAVRVSVRGVAFNQPVRVRPASLLQHMTYSEDSLERCGAPGQLADIYLTANAGDDLAGRIRDERGLRGGYFAPSEGEPPARLGSLYQRSTSPRERDEAGGFNWIRVNADGTVDLDAEFPYAAFRHVASAYEPWQPGRFAEPDHFHIEFEVVPAP
jgi:hypothetical protein